MKTNFVSCLSVLALSFAFSEPLHGQTTAATDPVGYTQLPCLANSDTRLSIPFTRPPEFTGMIQSISAPTGTAPNQSVTITVAASPNWNSNQFVYATSTQPKTYYAIIGPNLSAVTGTVNVTNGSTAVTGAGTTFTSQLAVGDALLVNGSEATVAAVVSDTSVTLVSPFVGTTATGATARFDRSPKEGAYYTVTANGSNTVTVNLNGDSLATLAANVGSTSVTLIPYWTLGTAFPASDAGVSFVASTSSLAVGRNTQIFMPDMATAGTDLAPNALYYFYNGAWRQAGQNVATPFDDTIILPTSYLILRNTATATTFTPVGSVYMNRLSIALDTLTTGSQDNAAAIARPSGVALNDLGLVDSGAFIPSTSSLAFGRKDTLLVYDNTLVGTDKSPSGVYYYYNNGWRLAGQPVGTDFGTTIIPYGTGFTIRKVSSNNGGTAIWSNTRNY